MSISMYQASIPHFIHMLNNLRHLLEKAATHAEAKKWDAAVLVNARLFPDMFALSRQVQIACDMAKGCGARLAGVEAPKYEDNESSFAELIARINKTTDFLKTLTAVQIDGSEEKSIHFTIKEYIFDFNGLDYLLSWSIPNVYFHITTTYNILRHNGVELGKQDFLGVIQ
jgi:hypothetical protein